MLNKMPAVKEEEIRLVRKYARTLSIILAIVFVGLFFYLQPKSNSHLQNSNAVIGGEQFGLEVASNQEQRSKGLSDRDSLGAQQGMLFVFDQPDAGCFWMKDMRFNLDIIWLDNNKHIVYLEQNLSPATYPHEYCPDNNAQFVIEVNAGTAKRLNVKVGDQITLPNR